MVCVWLQLAALQAELERMKMENLRLRDMLDQVNTSYNGLHMHLVSLMDQKADQDAEEQEGMDVTEGEKKQTGNGGVLVPRQFMDLGLAANADIDEPSLSSSVGRSQDGSPPGHNVEVASKEFGTRKNGVTDDALLLEQDKKEFGRGIEREDTPPPQAFATSKIPRFNPPENVDQAEATMRKARVSVRARSEAPMVHPYLDFTFFLFFFLKLILADLNVVD